MGQKRISTKPPSKRYMLDLFIALFGGLYYGGKYIHEKTKLNKYNYNASVWQKHCDDLRSSLCISIEDEYRVQDYVLTGVHYEEICESYAEDFEFVFGSKWIEALRIPPLPPVLDPKIYKDEAYYFGNPYNHIYWVYRLILASKGKVDSWSLTMGMPIRGSKENREMGIKFAQCIEKRLRQSGHPNLTFVLEEATLEPVIKIDTLCNHQYKRLW